MRQRRLTACDRARAQRALASQAASLRWRMHTHAQIWPGRPDLGPWPARKAGQELASQGWPAACRAG
eukprot:NODE_10396_length_442_cov_1.977099_g9288_i0.p2 GENE.NODE_10396_length_442_cov_1.977099_g9288_i0~~NODE_10396_length_442_cov_1.977099_g9288_i0.p2  ORF type:complete len:67 (+),score=1.25 NODE_10396_length_442_cov_1.977099_g9288_i0:79-279(+)